jgi:hypothetical protein
LEKSRYKFRRPATTLNVGEKQTMDILDKSELEMLMETEADVAVAIFLPTTPEPDKREENRIRLKNLVKEAEARLTTQPGHMRAPEAQRLLKPAESLLGKDSYWPNLSYGLACFLTANFVRTYNLPLNFAETVVVGRRFYIKPLLPLFTGNGRFLLLALSQNEVRLFEGTKYTMAEIEVEDMPASMAEALWYEDPEKQLQFHTQTSPAAGRGERQAIFHGHSDANDENLILQYCHKINHVLEDVLSQETAPLLLAGVEYLFSIYREANTYNHLLEEGVPGSPDRLTAKELHQPAWEIVEPYWQKAQSEAAEKYQQLAQIGQTSADVKEIVAAAHYGRVDTLFTIIERQQWGRFDPETGQVALDNSPTLDNEELLDLAAARTLANGGTVYTMLPEQMPGEGPLAAIFRY